jgi:cysteine synthase A
VATTAGVLGAIGRTPVVRLEIVQEVDGFATDQGGGAGFRPSLLGREDLDEVLAVSTADAFAMARRAAREEGLWWSGPSTGANLTVALELARHLGPGKRVVTPQVDSRLKYLAGDLYA